MRQLFSVVVCHHSSLLAFELITGMGREASLSQLESEMPEGWSICKPSCCWDTCALYLLFNHNQGLVGNLAELTISYLLWYRHNSMEVAPILLLWSTT